MFLRTPLLAIPLLLTLAIALPHSLEERTNVASNIVPRTDTPMINVVDKAKRTKVASNIVADADNDLMSTGDVVKRNKVASNIVADADNDLMSE